MADEEWKQHKLTAMENLQTGGDGNVTDGHEAVQLLRSLLEDADVERVRGRIADFKAGLSDPARDSKDPVLGSLLRDLDQISDSYTLERMRHYINRAIKSLTEKKPGRVNDINMNRWKDYGSVLTDSLWIFDRRDTSGEHLGWYWGNFVPQIPRQLLQRYSKQGDWVLDPFVGSGTTLIECRRLGRNGIGMDLNEEVVRKAEERIGREANEWNVTTRVTVGDSAELDYRTLLSESGVGSVQLVVMHPPYFDIIKFSKDVNDLSNSQTVDVFLSKLEIVVKKCYDVLEKGRYLAIVIGDKYEKGRTVPLGFFSMQTIMKSGFSLKGIVVKNFDETKGKRSQKELWRYRALVGEYYIFKHEYIFLFIKDL